MRMKRSRVNEIYLSRKLTSKDSEGVTIITYDSPSPIKAEVWPATEQLQVQTYGDRIRSIQNVKIQGKYEIINEAGHLAYQFEDFTLCEGDGIGIYNDEEPDYKIISITPYKPLRLEIEKL